MQYAIDEGVIVSVDSLSQLEMFGRLNRGGKLSVRINPGVGAGHHDKVVTAGKKTKFGVAAQDIEKIRDVAAKYDLHIIGLNQHIGSLFRDYKPFLEACRNFLHYAEEFDELEFLDFGGGFGTPYHKLADEQEFDIETFKKELDALGFSFPDSKANFIFAKHYRVSGEELFLALKKEGIILETVIKRGMLMDS